MSNQRQIKATDISDDPCNESMHLLVKNSSPSGNHFCNQMSFYHVLGERELSSIDKLDKQIFGMNTETDLKTRHMFRLCSIHG